MVLPVKRPVRASVTWSTGAVEARHAKNSNKIPMVSVITPRMFDWVMMWSFDKRLSAQRLDMGMADGC